jgi:hypothetical protein
MYDIEKKIEKRYIIDRKQAIYFKEQLDRMEKQSFIKRLFLTVFLFPFYFLFSIAVWLKLLLK